MKKYAVLSDNGDVVNIIIASSQNIAESVTSSHCVLIPLNNFVDIGYTYSDGTFTDPNAVTPIEETPA